jgi:predicted MFS family arabinose efflux permease
MALCGFSMSIFFPCFMDYISETVHFEVLDGTVSFVMTLIGIFLILMNWIIGWMAESFGITSALLFGPISLFFSLLVGIYLFKIRTI